MAWDDDRNRRERYDRDDWNERRKQGERDPDRGPMDRAGDEMRSWFGDEEAERRRRMDARGRGRSHRRGERYDRYEPGWEPGYRSGWSTTGRDPRNRAGYFPGDFYNRGYSAFGRGFGPDFTSNYDSDVHRVGEGLVLDDDVADYARSGHLHGPHAGRGPEGYQRSSERIVEDVSERLTRHGHVDARRIRVTAEEGEVTLEGVVDSRRTKRMAEDLAEEVHGVRDVHNRLRIDKELNRD